MAVVLDSLALLLLRRFYRRVDTLYIGLWSNVAQGQPDFELLTDAKTRPCRFHSYRPIRLS
jgi:hypothetical protein